MKLINLNVSHAILPFILGMFVSLGAYAQQITVKGNVKDALGEAVIGANVLLKGTTVGTITDFDGNFILNAEKGALIEISFIGYQTVEVAAATSLVVVLKDDTVLLSEAVVIGYGVVKKSDVTGSVTAIKPDKISKGMTTSAQDMMSGKIAGVNVTSDGGTPGGAATIRIRGGSSLNASNDPLIVIDGLAMDNDGIKGMSNALAFVNPNDIETFTVLKDASATAIYGSRASNGVIIITTKKGAAGSAPKVSYDGNVSFGFIGDKLNVMSAGQFREYAMSLWGDEANLPYALGTANTNWQNEIYRTAVSHDHNVTVSGGLKNMPYRISLGYTDQNGIIKTSEMQRYTGSLNLAPSFFDNHLRVNINTKFMHAKNRYADTGAVGAAAVMDPTRPVRDDADQYKNFGGYWQWTVNSEYADNDKTGWLLAPNSLAPQNPVALLNQKNDKAKSNALIANVELDYKLHFFPDLRVHVNVGGDYSEGAQNTRISPYSYSNHYYAWSGKTSEYKYNLSGNAYLQYTKTFNVHAIDAMVGAEQQHFHRQWNERGAGIDPITGDLYNAKDERYARHSSLVSYFGRINYTLMDRYLLTATIRQDGTSRFSKDNGNRWGTFPSVALGWKMKEEAFLRNVDVLSDLKLRLGWGVTGQQNINDKDFPYLPLYEDSQSGGDYQFGDEVVSTSRPNAYNTNLKWEETTTYNAGLDFGFLNGRITGSVDYYYRKTKDLLNEVKIAAGTNFNTTVLSNIGSLKNEGFEFTVNAKPVVNNDWLWEVSYNLTYNKNKITKLSGGDDPSYYVATGGISQGTGSNIQAHKVGEAASSFYVYQQVYDANGKPIENEFVDRNGDGIINDSDRYIYKKPVGDVLMGFTSKLMWKRWDFSFTLRASLNNYVYNDVIADRANVSTSGIYSTSGFYANRPVDAVKLGFSGKGNYYMSDYFVQNASFLRCDNITLGYSFSNLLKCPSYKGIEGRVYATLQNPFVITKYNGLDPEVNGGIDRDLYPRPTTFLLGVSLQF